jgi:hypothetical protein
MFQFLAIVDGDEGRGVRRIPVEGDLQRDLSQEFERQRNNLLPEGVEVIPYEPSYKPDDEVFVLESYALPGYLRAALEAPDALPGLGDADLEGGKVKSLFGARLGSRNPRQIIFQSFNAGQVLRRSVKYLFLGAETFQRSDRVGLRIDEKVTAVIEDGNLYFQSEDLVRRYLELDAYFQEATDEDIGKLLQHPSIAPAKADVVIDLADRWSRRKFTSIRERDILGKVPVSEIVKVGRKFGVVVATKIVKGKKKIVFPDDKREMKALLRFLDEDLLESPLTDARYQVSSKRRI